MQIVFDRLADPGALARRWRALEQASACGFFRSWTWLGAVLPHMPDPHVLAVTEAGSDLALGLFARTRRGLHLHETGTPLWDSLTIEHNGLLLRPGAEAALPASFAALLAAGHGPVTVSGTDAVHLAAARQAGEAALRARSFAPACDLSAIAPGASHLDGISANARAQIRRAMRLYGPELTLREAQTPEQAAADFDALVALHQQSWRARGKPGAFAEPAIRAFHHGLIASGQPRGEILLLRVAAGMRDIGHLYTFRHGGRVFSYQSGFAPEADARLKPGLVCHSLAIDHLRAAGATTYDLLAGASRYKLTLAPTGGETLHWFTLHRRWSPAGLFHAAKRRLRR